MEFGTIIGDKAYSVQYIADAQGNGHYGMSETVTGPNNITSTITAPPGSKINNFTIILENTSNFFLIFLDSACHASTKLSWAHNQN